MWLSFAMAIAHVGQSNPQLLPIKVNKNSPWEVINLTAATVCSLDILALTICLLVACNSGILLVFNVALTFARIYELLKVLSVTVCVEPVWHFLYKGSAGL